MSGERSKIRLRQAQAGEAARLRAIARAAYALYLSRMDREPAPMLADYGALIAAGEVEALDYEGRLVGFIVTRPMGDCLFVENLALDPATQGLGLGRFMMQAAEDKARAQGKTVLRLYTNAAMTENIPFYQALGFTVEDEREEDGYHRIYFVKQIADRPA